MPNAIDKLLAERDDLWRGGGVWRGDVLPTGHAALDRCLPGGGWPRGRLIELLPERPGSGELELLLPALAGLTRQGHRVLFIAPPLVPCPQALQRAGLDLARLLIVRDHKHAPWCAEQCLKSGLCSAVAIWMQPAQADARTLRRLQLAAGQSDASLFLLHPPGTTPPPSLACLRLAVRAGGGVEILRNRLGHAGGTVRLRQNNVVTIARDHHASRATG